MMFRNRTEAGRLLADKLGAYRGAPPLVLALPRGGVPVGAEIARILGGTLDTLVVRKLGSPDDPEFGFGAIGPDDVAVIYPQTVEMLGLSPQEIARIIASETEELHRRIALYKSGSFAAKAKKDVVILVDDGLATGVSAKAAVQAARKLYAPKKLVFAAPVAAPNSATEVAGTVDEFVAVELPPSLMAIGEWYGNFEQVSDGEVLKILEEANNFAGRR